MTEYDYDPATGLRSTAISYTGNTYNVSSLSPTTALSEAQLTTWAAAIADQSTVTERTDYTYDFRGNILTETSYSVDNTDGTGNTSINHGGGPATVVNYLYDQAGNLLQRYTTGGASNVETYVYDGLNRIISSTDANGATTTTAWTDGSNTAVTLFANGLTETSLFDDAGNLVNVTRSSALLPTETTSYAYDADQQLSAVTQTDSALSGGSLTSYSLYDAMGRKTADIADDGTVTEYRYDADSRLVATIAHYNKMPSGQINALISHGVGTDGIGHHASGHDARCERGRCVELERLRRGRPPRRSHRRRRGRDDVRIRRHVEPHLDDVVLQHADPHADRQPAGHFADGTGAARSIQPVRFHVLYLLRR